MEGSIVAGMKLWTTEHRGPEDIAAGATYGPPEDVWAVGAVLMLCISGLYSILMARLILLPINQLQLPLPRSEVAGSHVPVRRDIYTISVSGTARINSKNTVALQYQQRDLNRLFLCALSFGVSISLPQGSSDIYSVPTHSLQWRWTMVEAFSSSCDNPRIEC